MYCPLTPFLVCQHTCKAPQSWTCPNDRTLDFGEHSEHCLVSVRFLMGWRLGSSYMVGKHKAVLQQPRLFHPCFDRRVVGGTVDLGRGLAQPNKHVFNLGM